MFESYAQNGEDIVLWRTFSHLDTGFYVDVGAADPDEDSVTKAFYVRGWRGVNVEPAPDYAERLRQTRPLDVVVEACAGEEEGSVVLHQVVGTGLSSVIDSAIDALSDTSYEFVDVKVAVRRLDDLLVDAGLTPDLPVHFLKIDVEGFEESVIRGIDLTTWRPWVIVAESTKPRSTEQAHHDWEPLLLAHGYQFCLFDGLNRYYVADEHDELRERLSFPPSVFDQPYLTPPHAKLLREYENLLDGNKRLDALYHKAIVSYEEQGKELDRALSSYKQLESTYLSTIHDWQQLEGKYNETVASWTKLDHDHAGVIKQLEMLQDAHAGLRGEHDDVLAERATLRDGIARMGAEFDSLRAERDALRDESSLIRQTVSWRITRPLRAARRFSR